MQIALHDSAGPYQHVNVTISQVSVIDGSGNETILSSAPQTVDLLTLQGGVQTIIGTDSTLAPGTYSQIRLTVSAVDVVDNSGVDHQAVVPSGVLKLNNSFTVVAGTQTQATLDFDAAHSIVVTGNGQYKLKPVIKVESVTGEPAAQTGGVSGKVFDNTGMVIVTTGPTVTAYPTGTNFNADGIPTDSTVVALGGATASTTDGSYTLNGLPAGIYTLEYAATGFMPQTVGDVVVTAGSTAAQADVKLAPAPPPPPSP